MATRSPCVRRRIRITVQSSPDRRPLHQVRGDPDLPAARQGWVQATGHRVSRPPVHLAAQRRGLLHHAEDGHDRVVEPRISWAPAASRATCSPLRCAPRLPAPVRSICSTVATDIRGWRRGSSQVDSRRIPAKNRSFGTHPILAPSPPSNSCRAPNHVLGRLISAFVAFFVPMAAAASLPRVTLLSRLDEVDASRRPGRA